MTPDIMQAIDDPLLFGPAFPGDSWNSWRAVLRAAYALPMSERDLALFRAVSGDRSPPKKRVSELVIVAGRRAGKDSIASALAAHAAAFFDGSDILRPGERGIVACLACDRVQARIVLGYTAALFENGLLKSLVERETADGLDLTNQTSIEIVTNNFRNVRGRRYILAILDEVAFYRSENSAAPDVETYRAIKPGLSPGAMLVMISSPHRKSGLLYSKYKKHFGCDDDEVLVIQASSRDLNPMLDQSVIDAAMEEDPAAASAEWMGQFRDDISGWADRELIEAAVDRGVVVRPPLAGQKYFSFCDASGGVRDSFTAAVAHSEKEAVILDASIEIRAPFNPSTTTGQVADLLKSYGCRSTVGDKYAAQWVVQAFKSCGIDYRHSERDRSAIYSDCLPLLTTGRARLLDNKRLVNQLASLERRTSPSGKDRVDHGAGGSDDVANSAAGALVLAASKREPMRITDELLARTRQPAPSQSLSLN